MIGEQIRKARKALGWTQAKLAEESGTSQIHICNLENDRYQPGAIVIRKIAAALKISPGQLFE